MFDRLLGPERRPAGTNFDYPAWLESRIAVRRELYTARPDPSLFTIMTPVYDTPPQFLRELARSVLRLSVSMGRERRRQHESGNSGGGRRDPPGPARDVLCAWTRTRALPRPHRGIRNRHGRYVVPVDADDLIYPDALCVLATGLEAAGWRYSPTPMKTKSTKTRGPIRRFSNPTGIPCCFSTAATSPTCAIDRQAAAAANVYSDYEARGCPDLDMFARC